MVATVKQLTWGIVRYAPGSGVMPEDDAAAFDGWYGNRSMAWRVARDWHRRYPQWTVALVRSDQVWFSDRDFISVREVPLTSRETSMRA